MRVYHFLNEEFGLKDILEKRLKISRIMDLNDPFEFYSLEMKDPVFRRQMKAAKHEANEISGLICFSRNWKSPVQWAHYADKHKGLCLGFDIDFAHLEKVNYVNKRTKHCGEMNEKLARKLFKTKHTHWQYEEEYRVFVELQDEEDGLYYTDFKGNMELKSVMIGTNSNISRSLLNSVLGELVDSVETFKVRPGFEKFEMVKNKNDSMWK